MLVGGGAPEVGGANNGIFMCMRRSWFGGNLAWISERCVSQNGDTALTVASCDNHLEVVKALLAAGADKDAKGRVSA